MHVAAEKILSWAPSSLGEHPELGILLGSTQEDPEELGILLHGCCLRDLHCAGCPSFVCRRAPVLL